jgi:hypothetical protein
LSKLISRRYWTTYTGTEKLKKLSEPQREEEVEEQQEELEGGEVQLDEDETHEMIRTIMTMMMIVMVEDQQVVEREEPQGQGAEELVRGEQEVEVGVRMQVGKGGLGMVCPLTTPFRSYWRQMMAIRGHVHVVDRLLFELLVRLPKTLGGHSIPAQNPRGRHVVSS